MWMEVLKWGKHYPACRVKHIDGTEENLPESMEIIEAVCKNCMVEINKIKKECKSDCYHKGCFSLTYPPICGCFCHNQSTQEPSKDSEFKKCWALKNLQPLGFMKNAKKGKKIQ